MTIEFASLHNHSQVSILDAISTPKELVTTAKAKGLKRIAITDHGVAGSHLEVWEQGKKLGQPIALGVEAYLIHDLKQWNKLREDINLKKKEKGKTELVSGDELTEKDVGETNSK